MKIEIIELTFSETKYFKTDFQNKFKNSISELFFFEFLSFTDACPWPERR